MFYLSARLPKDFAMTLPVLNAPLLSSIVTWAYADHEDRTDLLAAFGPEWGSWVQGSWHKSKGDVCGSTYCIAGQTVAQVGYRLDLSVDEYDYNGPIDPETGSYGVAVWNATECTPVVFDGLDDKGKPTYREAGNQESISDVASRALGLTSNEAARLFDGQNAIEDIIAWSMVFAAARGVTLNLSDEIAAEGEQHIPNFAVSDWDGWQSPTNVFGGPTDYNDYADYNEAVIESGLWPTEPEPEPEFSDFVVTFRVNVSVADDSGSLYDAAYSEAVAQIANDPGAYHYETERDSGW